MFIIVKNTIFLIKLDILSEKYAVLKVSAMNE